MAKLTIEGCDLVVRLAPVETLVAFRKEVRVPLTAVRAAWVQPHPHEAAIIVLFPKLAIFPESSPARELPGPSEASTPWRVVKLPFTMQLVTISRSVKAFVALYGRRPAIRLDLDDTSPFRRMLLTVPDPGSVVADIRTAVGDSAPSS